MAYTLKTTGIPVTHPPLALLVVNEAGTGMQDLVTGNSITTNASVTFAAGSWNGVARNYFTTTGSGSSPLGIDWNATFPSANFASATGCSIFIAFHSVNAAGGDGRRFLRFFNAGETNGLDLMGANNGNTDSRWELIRDSSQVVLANTGSRINTKSSLGVRANGSTNGDIQQAAHGAALASVLATASPVGLQGVGPFNLRSLGGIAGNGWIGASIYCVYVAPGQMSNATFSALHADFFSETIEAGGAAVISSPTGTATGKDAASISVSTNTGSGTLYRLVSANATETAATIKTGATSVPTATGVQGPFAVTAMTPGAGRYAHFVQTVAAVDSNVVSSTIFTPSAMVGGGAVSNQTGTNGTAFVWSGAAPSAGFTGGIGTRTHTLGAGTLPAGITVNGTSGQLQGTPTAAGTFSALQILATDQSTAGTEIPQTELSAAFSLTVTTPATTATFLLTTDGNPANFVPNLTALKFAFFDEATPNLWTAPRLKGANGTTNASGVMTLNITGVTGLVVGQIGSVVVTNSDGTAGQGATLRFTFRCVSVS